MLRSNVSKNNFQLVFSLWLRTIIFAAPLSPRLQRVNPIRRSMLRLAHRSFTEGAVAQSVEQRTENPCVGGSIPPHTTKATIIYSGLFFLQNILRGTTGSLFLFSCFSFCPLLPRHGN